jgi:aerobic-type carbon monoxide dehydrogenase small subunit (CoxS/CutS family)
MPQLVQLHVNGAVHQVAAEPDRTLLGVLRDDLGLTGTKYGCGEGQCGACTVLLDGQRVRSCVTRMSAVAGKPVRTIESLAQGDELHPIQQAFLEADALQCGYCTPGMIMSAVALLGEKPQASRQEIIRFMDKNICRCGTYPRIVDAIERAGQAMKGGPG